MIAPDLRGYGDSDLSVRRRYDFAAYSRDVYHLMHDVLATRTAVWSVVTSAVSWRST